MYIIGNAATCRPVKMWADVLRILDDQNLVGPALHLHCPRHPDTAMAVRALQAFKALVPEAGCEKPCGEKLAS